METKIKISSIEVKYLGDVNKSNTVLPSECCDSLGKFKLPHGIFNKGVTGCGGTTLALQDNNNTVILAPRINLIKNKGNQHADALVWYSGVRECKNMGRECKKLEEYLDWCDKNGKRYKILTTYDSFIKMSAELPREDRINNTNEPNTLKFTCDWHIVVDEFQQLLLDCSFKASIEKKLLDVLSKFDYVTYMSATPLPKDILKELKLDALPYWELDWEHIEKVKVINVICDQCTPISGAKRIIEKLPNWHLTAKDSKGNTVECKEAVFFVNSVTAIVNLIHAKELKPEECNIIVANNAENEDLLKQLNKLNNDPANPFKIGSIPLKGEAHKPYTFCTSTAYMGVDFYSTNALTFVVSDTKSTVTSVDIALELAQIVGRQRLKDVNPFANEVYFIHNNAEEVQIEHMYEQIKKAKKTASLQIRMLEEAILKQEYLHEYNTSEECIEDIKKGFIARYNTYKAELWTSFISKTDTVSGYEFNNLTELALKYSVNQLNDVMTKGVNTLINSTSTMHTDTKLTLSAKVIEEVVNVIKRVNADRILAELALDTKRYMELREQRKATGSRIVIGKGYNELTDTPEGIEAQGTKGEVNAVFDLSGKDYILAEKCNYKYKTFKGMVLLNKRYLPLFIAYLDSRLLNKSFDSKKEIKEVVADFYKRQSIPLTAKATDIEDFGYKIVQTSTKVAGVKTNIFKVEKV